ncbi:MAG TPA: YeeE/YedE thiosulfate transporter family protein [Flavitalea sp.]|nr:YeeE/YedE thiosulfate transporter family protein [Flavitalea sp.]
MIEWLSRPWPWYIAGPLIGLMVPFLLIFGNKTFGISSSLRHICAAIVPSKIPFFSYDWKKEAWNLFFVAGVLIGGFIAARFLDGNATLDLSPQLSAELTRYGVSTAGGLLPTDLFRWENLVTIRGFILIVVGGFLVGFGTRYAGGCTSGHSIMGLSNLQLPSLIATCCFMAGGFIMANLVLPIILKLV